MPRLVLLSSGRKFFRFDPLPTTGPVTFTFTIQGTSGAHMLDVVFSMVPGTTTNPNNPAGTKTLTVSQQDLARPDARFVVFVTRSQPRSDSRIDITQNGQMFRISKLCVTCAPIFDGIDWQGPLMKAFFTIKMN